MCVCGGQVELEGLTGHIEFNSKGQRSNYALRIMQNGKDGLRQVKYSPCFYRGEEIISLPVLVAMHRP